MASLRKSLETMHYRNLQAKYAANRSNLSFDWDWDATLYNRIALINHLVARKRRCRYLEIGCENDLVFKAVPATAKTGVDPVQGGTIRQTSDAFFAANHDSFDVIFIDGLHTYEQVRRDVVNALACIEPDGWIVLHDMLPRNWVEGHSPRITRDSWTGDVWKVAFDLAQTEGVDFRIVKIDHGCCVIRASATRARLADRYDEMKDATFAYLHAHIGEIGLIEWDAFREWVEG